MTMGVFHSLFSDKEHKILFPRFYHKMISLCVLKLNLVTIWSFLHIGMTQVVEIFPQVRQELTYPT